MGDIRFGVKVKTSLMPQNKKAQGIPGPFLS